MRNETLARLAGHLLRHFVDSYVTLDLIRAVNSSRCSPPLGDAEVITIVNSIARKEADRMASYGN